MSGEPTLTEDDILNRAYAAYLRGGSDAALKQAKFDGATETDWCSNCVTTVWKVKNLCVVCWQKLDDDGVTTDA